jgi:hypothetical protein
MYILKSKQIIMTIAYKDYSGTAAQRKAILKREKINHSFSKSGLAAGPTYIIN